MTASTLPICAACGETILGIPVLYADKRFHSWTCCAKYMAKVVKGVDEVSK